MRLETLCDDRNGFSHGPPESSGRLSSQIRSNTQPWTIPNDLLGVSPGALYPERLTLSDFKISQLQFYSTGKPSRAGIIRKPPR
jgi:hypothetical protein